MQIQSRCYTSPDFSYRFGFNGKESDDEVSGSGNQYDYGFRIYNPRIGKFLSVDPLFRSYPWYTPYQFAGNQPIAAIDLDGLEEQQVNQTFNLISSTPSIQATDNTTTASAPIILMKQVFRDLSYTNAPYKYQFKGYAPDGSEIISRAKYSILESYAKRKMEEHVDASSYIPSKYFAKRLIKHWLLGDGNDYVMNKDEMNSLDIPSTRLWGADNLSQEEANFGITGSKTLQDVVNDNNETTIKLLSDKLATMKAGETADYNVEIKSYSLRSAGTLGQFTIKIEGKLTKTGENTYSFEGTKKYIDTWDFDPNWNIFDASSSRPSSGSSGGDSGSEGIVRKVKTFQVFTGVGDDFEISSEALDYSDSGTVPEVKK